MMQFGSVLLDLKTRELRLGDSLQHLEPQAFDLLAYLVEHRDRVVSKPELLDAVWGDQFVSESALTTRIKEIRRATGDDGRKQEVVKNFRGRGYRFVAVVTELKPDVGAAVVGDQSHHVPAAPLTPSVGLEAEIARLVELTKTRRLITIVGPGGVGKTRLSVEVGRIVAQHHALGARIVELSRISQPDAIGPTIRRALDLSERSTGRAGGLGSIDALLVLDNCEHLIDAVASEVPALLAEGEKLHILATSREPMNLGGELRWALAPLSAVGADAPALALFRERAGDVAVEIDAADPLAHSIVTRLDGIPLALEMAAARLATTGLADLADEIERSVASLIAGPRGVAERHSTLRAVLAWSEALLSPEHRVALADFSIFAGPVDGTDLPGAVEADDPVGAVRSLAERSLVTVDTTNAARARYGTLETVRQFSRERLAAEGRLNRVGRRHATWFTEAAEEMAQAYDSANQPVAVARVDRVFDELRAAHLWARTNDHSLAGRLSHSLLQPAFQEQRLEVFDWSLALAEAIGDDQEQAVELYGEVSLGLTFLGRIDEARRWAERSINLATDPVLSRAACGTMCDIALYEGDLHRSLQLGRQYVELSEKVGSNIERAYGIASVALPLAYLGRHDEALALIPAELPAAAPPSARAWLAYTRGEVLLDSDPHGALHELDTAISLAEAVNGHFLRGVAQVSAASLRTRTGQAEDAIIPLRQTIESLVDHGNVTHLLTTLRNLPTLLARLGEWHGAAEILGGLSHATISPTYGDEADRLAAAEQATRSALGDAAFERVHGAGAFGALDQTARRAIALLVSLSNSASHAPE